MSGFVTETRPSGNGLLLAFRQSRCWRWRCPRSRTGVNFLLAATFLSLGGAIARPGAFYLYAGIAGLVLFFLRKVPETKDRSLEEIQENLANSHPGNTGSQVHQPKETP